MLEKKKIKTNMKFFEQQAQKMKVLEALSCQRKAVKRKKEEIT